MQVDVDDSWCGCDVRKETIGSDAFWNIVVVSTALTAVLLAKGGTVSKQTRTVLSIALGGAILALSTEALRKQLGKSLGLKL